MGHKENDGQLTEEQAIGIGKSDIWKQWSDEEIVKLQLYQEFLCVDFGRYHKAIERVLGRSVWPHEFTRPDLLRKEYEGARPKPTPEDIIGLMPEDKQTILVVP